MPSLTLPKGVKNRQPLLDHVRTQADVEIEMRRLLARTTTSINREMRKLGTGRGALVRTDQLTRAQVAANQRLADYWRRVGDVVKEGRVRAAASAAETMLDPDTLGSIMSAADREFLVAGATESAVQSLDVAEARLVGSRRTLAESVWGAEQATHTKLNDIIGEALARGASAAELARDVRDYVRPDTPGGVRYASQRLARTELNNAFHVQQVRQAEKTPWVYAVQWHLSGSHPVPDECNDYAEGTFFQGGEAGQWRPEEVPAKPHPNCLCFTTPVTPSREQFIDSFLKGDYDNYLAESGLVIDKVPPRAVRKR